MAERKNTSSERGWLYVIPIAVIAVMLFLIGYHIIQRYEGENFSLKEARQPIASDEVEGSPSALPVAEEETAGGEETAKIVKFKPDDIGKKYVNINTASATELRQLPGIGEIMAKRIIERREKKGRFRRIEDIGNVKGVGDKVFEEIKPYIVVE